jgi:hypothetical protein
VRGESIWTEREHAVVLTDNGRRRRCSGGNQRGQGGVSGGGSRRGGHIGGGEGGELEIRLGCRIEWRCQWLLQIGRRMRENTRGKWGGGSARCRVEEGKWERAPGAVVGSVG